jgi:molecular chaperone DnaK
MAKDNRSIGRFMLDSIPPAMRGIPQIEVTFDIDANGIINVSAMDKGTNKKQNIRIEASSGLSKEEIEKMKQEAEANAESDKKAKEDAETLNLGDTTIFQIEKSLKDLDDKITEEQKSEVTADLDELKKAHSEKDVEKVKELVEKVNTTFQNISMNLYQQAQDMGGQPTNEGDVEVTDVDFEEVEAK